jgi:titin
MGVALWQSASRNRIGTNGDGVADAAEANLISANGADGVHINGFSGGVADDNIVAGNFIGTDVTGSAALGNGRTGVLIANAAHSNRIGTDADGVNDAAERNIISGNTSGGIHIQFGALENIVAGNFIGTNAAGSAPLGNSTGVFIFGEAAGNTIGGSAAGAGNLISGNRGDGVRISGSDTNNNVVVGNYLGTNAAGTGALGNMARGVGIFSGAHSNRIGTNGDGVNDAVEGNLIAFNTGKGVVVSGTTTTGNLIRRNAIHSNGGLGIDLGDDGVTANDAGDTDTGPNDLQNFPVLIATVPGASTAIAGTLNSLPNTTFIVDFYAGARHLSSTTVLTDASGNASFNLILAAATSAGEVITATATDPSGNTSELAAVVTAQSTTLVLCTAVTNLVSSGTLNQGQGNSLCAKLEAAQKQIDRGHNHTAINILQAFINHVNDFVAEGVLTPQEAALLLDGAALLILQLGG